MTPPSDSTRTLRDEDGFALAELLIAMVIASVGLLATFGAMDAARALTTLSEAKEAGTHVAQQEIERIQAMDYAQVGLTSMPASSSDPHSPLHRVTAGTYAAKAGQG